MNTLLWIVQVLLSVVFLAHGAIFLAPPARMKAMLEGGPLSPGLRRFIGLAEVLAAVGLIFPGLLGILTWLAPLAAAGLVVVMAGAVVFHLLRREARETLVTTVILALAGFVAYIRWAVLPF